jgi:hypothetical protein
MTEKRDTVIEFPSDPLIDPDGREITVIIYHGNKPFSVFNGKGWASSYDFEWCENDNVCAYHLSGSGGLPYVGKYWNPTPPTVKVWVRPGTRLTSDAASGKAFTAKSARRKLARWGMKLIDSPILLPSHLGMTGNPFQWNLALHGDAEYCTVCGVFHFDDGWGDGELCEHVGWCEDCALPTGSGVSDGCDCWKKEIEGSSSIRSLAHL